MMMLMIAVKQRQNKMKLTGVTVHIPHDRRLRHVSNRAELKCANLADSDLAEARPSARPLARFYIIGEEASLSVFGW